MKKFSHRQKLFMILAVALVAVLLQYAFKQALAAQILVTILNRPRESTLRNCCTLLPVPRNSRHISLPVQPSPMRKHTRFRLVLPVN